MRRRRGPVLSAFCALCSVLRSRAPYSYDVPGTRIATNAAAVSQCEQMALAHSADKEMDQRKDEVKRPRPDAISVGRQVTGMVIDVSSWTRPEQATSCRQHGVSGCACLALVRYCTGKACISPEWGSYSYSCRRLFDVAMSLLVLLLSGCVGSPLVAASS